MPAHIIIFMPPLSWHFEYVPAHLPRQDEPGYFPFRIFMSRIIPMVLRSVGYIFTRFNLSAFNITETELKLIAAAAMMGESSRPKNGYSTPAAIGMPSTL